jgi:cytochrome P450
MTPETAGLLVTDAKTYADPVLFTQATAVLRRSAPIWSVEPKDYRPLWIVSRHADVLAIEGMPHSFTSAPRSILTHRRIEEALQAFPAAERPSLRTLVHLDGTEHADLRRALRRYFNPDALARLAPTVDKIVTDVVLETAHAERPFDAVEQIASRIPLQILLHQLGLPREAEAPLRHLTQGLFSPEDPTRRLHEDPGRAFTHALVGFQEFLMPLLDREDLAQSDTAIGALCRAQINGRPLSRWDLFSNLVLLLTAGHDTTAYAFSFTLKVVAEDPELLDWLHRDPERCFVAAKEMVRLASPVRSFLRNATGPVTIHETELPKGATVLLLYPSANMDEDVFDDAATFRPDRCPNPHLGFGSGPHHCLGSRLAMMQIEAFLRILAAMPIRYESAGTPIWSRTVFVGGIRELRLSTRLR